MHEKEENNILTIKQTFQKKKRKKGKGNKNLRE